MNENVNTTDNHKMMIILRTDKNMRKGKMVSQGGHAIEYNIFSEAVDTDDGLLIPKSSLIYHWMKGNSHKKIGLGIDSEKELLELYETVKKAGLICSLVLDSGLTEFNGVPTYTAVAIGPDDPDKIDPYTKHLKPL